MTTKISTDWHIGVSRSGGTTPASQVALRTALVDTLAECLDDNPHLIAGDLFDKFQIDTSEVLKTYKVFAEWLAKYGQPLTLIRGNHDHNERGSQVSSFDFLATVLEQQFPTLVTVARDVTHWREFILVPHLPNQDLLDQAIENLGDVAGKFVVFHANLANKFAEASDHSLNVSTEQVVDLIGRGATLLFGHEHISRSLYNGRVIVLGNTHPSSIADCIGHGSKYAYAIDGGVSKVETWSSEGYVEMDWQELDYDSTASFIRVTGSATVEQAEAVVEAVAKFRSKHSAFVISNAVRVDGVASQEALESASAETIRSFDVMSALLEGFDEREREVLRGLV